MRFLLAVLERASHSEFTHLKRLVDSSRGIDGVVGATGQGGMWNLVVDGAAFGVAALAVCNGLAKWPPEVRD